MKKMFTTLALLMLSASLFAQTEFIPLGATWFYRGFNVGYGSPNPEYNTAHEVIAEVPENGVIKKVVTTKQEYAYVRIYPYDTLRELVRSGVSTSIDSLYEQNDTVFIYNHRWERYTPLYVFNVNEGDTIKIPSFHSYDTALVFESDSFLYFIVDSIRLKDFGGHLLETYYTRNFYGDYDTSHANFPMPLPTSFPKANWSARHEYKLRPDLPSHPDATFTELLGLGGYTRKFGGFGGGLLPLDIPNFDMILYDGDIREDKIACYYDTSIQFNLYEIPCDSFFIGRFVSIKPIQSSGISIYPNPLGKDGIMTIQSGKQLPADARLNVLNMNGQVLRTATIGQKTTYNLDLSSLPAGVYFVVFEYNSQRYYHRVVKSQ